MNPSLITVKKYDSLIEKGILTKYDRVELLNGIIVEKPAKTPQRCYLSDKVTYLFFKLFDEIAIVRNQNPIWLDEFSEPEPDIVLAIPKDDEYENSHPTPDEIFLILEVSDSTLSYDRNTKGEAYARAGIRQYLVLNVPEKTVEDYREPGADGFQSKQTHRAGQEFNLERLKLGYTENDGLVRTGSGSDRLKMRVSRSLPLPVLTRRDRICNP
jgi:hypothetical protein